MIIGFLIIVMIFLIGIYIDILIYLGCKGRS